MWIKALLCTEDTDYANRLVDYFDSEYANRFELNVCSSVGRAVQLLEGMDIVMFGKEFEEEVEPKIRLIQAPVVIITEQVFENGLKGTHQVEKYQRADIIYKQLLNIYAEGANVKAARIEAGTDAKQKIVVFTSPNGGNGTTSIARAYARKCASFEKTLYLDMSLFGGMTVTNGTPNGMDDVIMALKSRRNILSIKLSSALAETRFGFYSYGICANPLDLMEINAGDVEDLIKELSMMTEYSKIVVDIGNTLSEKELVFLKSADAVVAVVDEREISVEKFDRLMQLLVAVERKEQVKITKKLNVIRNMIDDDYDMENWPYQQKITGWAPYIGDKDSDSVIEMIANSDTFNNLEI